MTTRVLSRVTTEELFDEIIKHADTLGFNPSVSKLAALGVSLSARPKQVTGAELTAALSRSKKASKEYDQIKIELGKYLFWSTYYLFMDGEAKPQIKREPAAEAIIHSRMLGLLMQLKLV